MPSPHLNHQVASDMARGTEWPKNEYAYIKK